MTTKQHKKPSDVDGQGSNDRTENKTIEYDAENNTAQQNINRRKYLFLLHFFLFLKINNLKLLPFKITKKIVSIPQFEYHNNP